MDDVVLNKAAIVERCLARVREVYAGDVANLRDDITKQDSIFLNLQRACEATIDLAMHLVRLGRLGLPQDSRDAFDLLVRSRQLDAGIAEVIKRMVGFRNIAVHEYQDIDLDIVQTIVEKHVGVLADFARAAVTRWG